MGFAEGSDFQTKIRDHLNTGHGHVRPRPDGILARCGGPAICRVCAGELAQIEARRPPPPESLVAALQDRINTEARPSRPAESVRLSAPDPQWTREDD